MTVSAYAKVNLTLEVLGERSDGYHALRSLVLPVSLADTLTFAPAPDGFVGSDTGYGEADLAVRAARELGRACGVTSGVRISVVKNIPTCGGLGGGSADAAATLLALNRLWRLGLSPETLASVGAAVGSDVPALVMAHHYRRMVLMEGRGEVVRLATAEDGTCPAKWLVLANPGCASSTPEVFRAFKASTYPNPKNDLQVPAIARHPEIGVALSALRAAGARDVMMSGSGSTVFGFAADEAESVRIAATMRTTTACRAWSVRALD